MFIRLLNLKFNKTTLEGIHVAIWTDTSGMVERHPTDATKGAMDWLEANGVDREYVIHSLELSQEDQEVVKSLVSNHSIEGLVAYKINDVEISNYICRPSTELFFKSVDSEYYIFAVLSNKSYRVELRSKNKDVSATAKKFGGGGHKTSSGCIAASKEIIMKIIEDLNN